MTESPEPLTNPIEHLGQSRWVDLWVDLKKRSDGPANATDRAVTSPMRIVRLPGQSAVR